jgi:hypothetical protein
VPPTHLLQQIHARTTRYTGHGLILCAAWLVPLRHDQTVSKWRQIAPISAGDVSLLASPGRVVQQTTLCSHGSRLWWPLYVCRIIPSTVLACFCYFDVSLPPRRLLTTRAFVPDTRALQNDCIVLPQWQWTFGYLSSTFTSMSGQGLHRSCGGSFDCDVAPHESERAVAPCPFLSANCMVLLHLH